MRVTEVIARSLYAELSAPMRSRGDVGYTEFFHTGSEYQRITVVELLTDTSHRGVTLLHGHAGDWIRDVAKPALIGRDPRTIRHCREALGAAVEAGGKECGLARGHINRIEFALWDLVAKSAGLPLFRLLGGGDPHVRVYAGGGSLCWNPLPLIEQETEVLLEFGFRALKIKIGRGPDADAETVRAVRRICGPDVAVMVDANRAYDLPGALRLVRVLEEEGVGWFEEPFTYDDAVPWQALQLKTSVRLSGGEGFHRLAQVSDALRDGIVQILQCDAGGYGLEALLAIGSMAHELGAALTPHSCNNLIGFVVACHLQPALPNGELQEFETFDNPFIHSLFNESFALCEGKICLTEAPGARRYVERRVYRAVYV